MSDNNRVWGDLLPGEKLERYWRESQKPSLCKSATEEKVRIFERLHGILMPKDFRDYVLRVNGFDQAKNYQDDRGFNFWPLESIVRVAEYEDGRFGFSNDDNYFIFCDYLDFSWAYAISFEVLVEQVIKIGAENGKPIIMANTFAEFVDRYLEDDGVLYI
jgi:hypothetical protein